MSLSLCSSETGDQLTQLNVVESKDIVWSDFEHDCQFYMPDAICLRELLRDDRDRL